MERICKICGQPFTTSSSRKQICSRPHYRVCEICGCTYLVKGNQLYSKSSICGSLPCINTAKGRASKPLKFECICRICGNVFKSTAKTAAVCSAHNSLICQNCGKEFPATHDEIVRGLKTCSDKCRYELTHRTYDQNYGKVTNPDNFKLMQAKYKASMLTKYGSDNPMGNADIAAKSVASKRERYGNHFELMNAKRKQTCIDKYGVESTLQLESVKEKSRRTCLEKYGVDNYAKSVAFRAQVIIDPNRAEQATEFNNDARTYITSHFPDHQPTLRELSIDCGMRESSIGWIIDRQHCQDMIAYAYSYMEDEVYEYLDSILPKDAIIQRNTFKVITPYELDIYLPEYRIAIECNPTWTHNSSVAIFESSTSGDLPKDKNYHKLKSDLCEEAGIFLFHIFGYEWTHKKSIIQSMLANMLHANLAKLNARSCQVQEISHAESAQFLAENHRQGACNSKVRLGLFYSGQLVSLMTFSSMRNTIGASSSCGDDCWELARFCSLKNTSVRGAASKLFQHFVKSYQPREIRSFSDRAHTRGELYEKLGFSFQHTSDPGYMWVNLKTDVGYARNNAQKQNLAKFLNDTTLDLSKTEVQIMEEHDFVQVFDSGVKLWVWKGGN